ncbi:nucleotide exchange factor GrpE [Helicobacter cholecystus]|uniref:Protein GrpE n=1 Tax=Helicobacter cholecystus TaxID=45498 RepID=A0A3D8ITV7_9HELI|nr:nucleotide exchange factor GrpE [Helicobacter cholecystus]RDU68737.1 nucleotide exchange factor GrpE [Helicobacter cholecystus]VEJ26232.1 heat shock protein GrpE [Helicobacter cholecystus]
MGEEQNDEVQACKEENLATQSNEDFEEKFKNLEQEYLRVHADFENVKKRLEREKYQALEYCYEGIAKDLLPVVDTLEKAYQSAIDAQQEAISDGIKLTLDNLLKVLSKHGIEVIDQSGSFDPQYHDAIMQVPSNEVEEGQIVQTLQKGYQYKQRVLRPAMVSVAKN